MLPILISATKALEAGNIAHVAKLGNRHHALLPVAASANKGEWGKSATILRNLLQDATIADILEAKKTQEAEELSDQGEATFSTCYKESLEKRLKKLMPGATSGVHTLLINNKLITDKEEIGKHLKEYWQKVFKKQAPSKAAKEK